jgi:YgiT-type zinc finger domain-containing protein
MICDICGNQGAEVRYVTRSYGKGKNLLIIENVPVVVCPTCGESYLTVETLHEIERIKLHRRTWRSSNEWLWQSSLKHDRKSEVKRLRIFVSG